MTWSGFRQLRLITDMSATIIHIKSLYLDYTNYSTITLSKIAQPPVNALALFH